MIQAQPTQPDQWGKERLPSSIGFNVTYSSTTNATQARQQSGAVRLRGRNGVFVVRLWLCAWTGV
jgi:hypothetical protein